MTRKKNRFLPTLAMFIAVPLALTACGGGGSETPSEPADGTTEPAGEEQVVDGGTLNIGVHVEPTDWSPSRVQSILFPFTDQIYDALIDYDDELNPSPSLATEWQIADDNSGVTITLRDDVKFHGGDPLTADAVAANLEFFANPETGQQLASPMTVVDSWNVVDDTTIEVTFTQPLPQLQITDLLQSWRIGDPATLEDQTSGEGTGAYVFKEWVQGDHITLVRNDEYWGGTPAYEELYYRVFSDKDSMIAGLESGVIDVAVDVPPLDAQRLQGTFEVLTGHPGALIDVWRINPTIPPWDNKDVRMALNYATDRQAIMDATTYGFGSPLALPYPAESPAYDEELAATLEYDLDKARQHIEASGLSESELKGTVLTSSTSPRAEQAGQILQASLAEIGFNLEIEIRDSAEYQEKLLGGDFELVFSGIGNAQKYPTRITTNSIYRIEDNPVNATEVFPDYKPAVEAANAAVTEADQAAAFQRLNEVLVDAMWVVAVGSNVTTTLVNQDAVTGVDRTIDNFLVLKNAKPAG